jgi:hypothetical protein
MGLFFGYFMSLDSGEYDFNSSGAALIGIIYVVMGIFYALISVLGIIGGILAIKKKHWGWALAGAIAGALTFFPCGIAAVVLTTLGKPEFSRGISHLPASVPEL